MSVTHRQSIGYRRPLRVGWFRGRQRLRHATGRRADREGQSLLTRPRSGTLDWTSRRPTSDSGLLRVLLTVGVATLVAGLLAGNALAAWVQAEDDLVPAALCAAIVAVVFTAMSIPVLGEFRRRRRRTRTRRSAD
ncbi:hypothetical protein [Thermobifida halotolerans]|nr:hypothetical protein [Thermobifida halotolerans]